MAAGSIAKVTGSGQAMPTQSASVIDVGTIDTDPDSILTEVSAGRYRPDSEGFYLVVAAGRFDETHNNRVNIKWEITRNSTAIAGTGGTGYARNNFNPYAYMRAGAILYFNGSSDYLEVSHVRDAGAGTPAGTYNNTRLKVVQLSAGDSDSLPYARYGTPTSGSYSGATPTAIGGWDAIVENDTATIELQVGGTDIRLKEANRPYLIIYGLENSDSGSSRTTRVSDVTVGGTRIPHSAGYAYQRDAANQQAVPFGMALVRPTSANQDLNVRCWGHDLTLQGTFWGTFVDGSWTLSSAAGDAGVMVIALPATTDIAVFDDNTANQLIAGSGDVTLTSALTEVDADGTFTRDSSSAVTVDSATEVIAYSAYMIERTASSGTRNTSATRWVVEGVELTAATEYGSYLRGDQSTQDTPNMVIGSLFVDSTSANDTFVLEKFDPGTDDGNNDRSSWGGSFYIDLSSLAAAAPTSGAATDTADTASGVGTFVSPPSSGVEFRASSVRDTGSAANITIPTGTVADDVIIANLYTEASSPTLTGFTSLYNTALQSGYYQNSFYRVATGSEGGNTVTCSAAVHSFVAGSYSGGEFDSSAGSRADSGSTITSGTVTPSANDCMLVFTCGTWDADGSSTIAAPSGMTLREAPYVDWEPLNLSDELLSGGSGVGVTRSTPNPYVGNQSWTATLVSIKPVGGGSVDQTATPSTVAIIAAVPAPTVSATSNATASGSPTDQRDDASGAATFASSASGATTDTVDTAAGSGTVASSASGATTDTVDTAAGSGTVASSASGAVTDLVDTAAGSGTVASSASGAVTDLVDTAAGSGTVASSASGAVTDTVDTVAGSGTVASSASGAVTDLVDTVAGSGTVASSASGAVTDTVDTVAGSGTVASSASGAVTDSRDTASGVSSSEPTSNASGAVTDLVDTASGTGTLTSSATGSATDAPDLAAGTATLASTASGSISDQSDSASGSGVRWAIASGSPTDSTDTLAGQAGQGSSAAGSATDAADLASGAGTITLTASGAPTDAQDAAAGTAGFLPLITASGAPTDAQDAAAGVSASEPLSTASGAPTDAQDAAAGTGTLTTSASGAPTDAQDAAAGTGAALALVVASGAPTDAQDAAAGAGTLTTTASGAPTDAQDAAAGQAGQNAVAIGTTTDTPDAASGSGTVAVSASGAIQDAPDQATGTGDITSIAAGAGTDALDVANGSGSASAAAASASGSPTDTQDQASGAAARWAIATGDLTDQGDTSAGVSASEPISRAVGGVTDRRDMLVAAGIFITPAAGSGTDGEDGAAGVGSVASPASGSPTDGTDVAVGTATYFSPPSHATGAATDQQDTITSLVYLNLITLNGEPLALSRIDSERQLTRLDDPRSLERADDVRQLATLDTPRSLDRIDPPRQFKRSKS